MSATLNTTAIFGSEILPPMLAKHVSHFKLKVDVVTFVRFNEPASHTARVKLHTESGFYQRLVKQVDLPCIATVHVMTSIFDTINDVLANSPDDKANNVSSYDLQVMEYLLAHSDAVTQIVTKRIGDLMA